MELILKENVHGLGYKDDIVNVKNGYGRNYLIPTGKAVIASPSAKKMLAEELKQRAHKLEKIKNDALALAEKLGAIEPIVVATKVSATGVIYGSVNALQLADELAKRGFEIDRKIIDVKEGCRQLQGRCEAPQGSFRRDSFRGGGRRGLIATIPNKECPQGSALRTFSISIEYALYIPCATSCNSPTTAPPIMAGRCNPMPIPCSSV